MSLWFFIFGIPLTAYGLVSVFAPALTAKWLVSFPRNKAAGRALAVIGWIGTAYELDNIGIEAFDRYLKAFPGELWILAAVLTVLTCLWMENLLPIRGVSAIFMLFPAELFPRIRLEPSSLRLVLVVFAYLCAMIGMFGMFYPWRIRQALAWRAAKPIRVIGAGAVFLVTGVAFLIIGCIA